MNYTLPKIITGLLVAGILASCTASIKETWRNPAAPATVYSKVLVVAIANDDNVRQLFENIFSQTLRDHGIEAVPSYKLISNLDKANRKLLQETARQVRADGVAITRGISKSERTNYQYGTGEVMVMSAVMQESGPNSSMTVAMSGVGVAPRQTDFELASLQTNFFDTASTKLVWSARSKVSESGNRADACWDLSALLVKALRKDRVIGGR